MNPSRSKLIRATLAWSLTVVVLGGIAFFSWSGWKHVRATREYDRVRTLAANLANDEFDIRFGQRPFRPEMYEPELRAERWYWGSFEPAQFFSAEVSFRKDTTDPKVRVFWATDGHERFEPGPEPPRNEGMPNLAPPDLIDR